MKGVRVDYAAHFGGAIGGTLVALVALALWRQTESRPRLQAAALAVAIVGCACFAYATVPIRENIQLTRSLPRWCPRC